MRMTEKHAPISIQPNILYVCSAARSGSTLTDMFLGGHSQVASLGELGFLNKDLSVDEFCSCGQKLRECSAWGSVFDRLGKNAPDLRQSPYALRLWDAIAYDKIDHAIQTPMFKIASRLRNLWLDLREAVPAALRPLFPIPPIRQRALQNKIALYNAIAASWNKRLLVDSSKNPHEAMELYRRWPDRVRIVLVVRDGRGVFLSRLTSGFGRNDSLKGWRNYYRRALRILDTGVPASNLLKLRYEDFASKPDDFGRRLCEFCGLDFESQMLDLGAATRHMVNGNDTRFKAGRGIYLDERWRTQLSVGDLEYFLRKGGAMNSRLGYT